MEHKFSLRTRIMYCLERTVWYVRDKGMLILCCILWSTIYGIYYSSGIKIMLDADPNQTWKEQMRVYS